MSTRLTQPIEHYLVVHRNRDEANSLSTIILQTPDKEKAIVKLRELNGPSGQHYFLQTWTQVRKDESNRIN